MNISFLKEKGNKYLIYILGGVLVLVLLIPTNTSTLKSETEESDNAEVLLAQQLEHVLSAMEGVGKVEVMITMDNTQDSIFGSSTNGQKVAGVVIVAEGASSATVNARISEAVKALFSVDAHKISIVKMKSEEESR